MVKAMRTVYLRERLAVGGPLADDDLLLSRADGTWLPVPRLFARVRRAPQSGWTQGSYPRQAAPLEHLADARGRHRCRCRRSLARAHRAHDAAFYGRVTDDRLTAASAVFSASTVGQSKDKWTRTELRQQTTLGRLPRVFLVELRGLEPLTPTLPVWCATSCAIAPRSCAARNYTTGNFPSKLLVRPPQRRGSATGSSAGRVSGAHTQPIAATSSTTPLIAKPQP